MFLPLKPGQSGVVIRSTRENRNVLAELDVVVPNDGPVIVAVMPEIKQFGDRVPALGVGVSARRASPLPRR